MRMGEWSERKTEEEDEGEIGGRSMRRPRNRGGKEENWEEEDVYVKMRKRRMWKKRCMRMRRMVRRKGCRLVSLRL